MPATQPNALAANPNGLVLTRIGTLDRVIRAPIVRVWENVLDWEHLPHLHASSFDAIVLADAGDWGWRTWSGTGRDNHIELCVDVPNGRYVARSYQARRQVSEIWTRLRPEGESTAIEVTFDAVDVRDGTASQLGRAYRSLYERLWDEDEAMMTERHRRLSETRSRATTLDLGDEAALDLPVSVRMMGSEYVIARDGGDIVAQPAICPHLLGPLDRADDGSLWCPWHGYRFDAGTGACLAPPEATCRLPRTPTVTRVDGRIVLTDPRVIAGAAGA